MKVKIVGSKQTNGGDPEPVVATPQAQCEGSFPTTAFKKFFDVPFEKKEMAKELGLKWDNSIRKWYADNSEISAAFSASFELSRDIHRIGERRYFNVPFLRKDRAKAIGMRFDGTRKLWYTEGAELALTASRLFLKVDDILS